MSWATKLPTTLLFVGSVITGAGCSAAEDFTAAQRAVEHVHELFAQKDFSKIYVAGDPALREVSEAEFVRSMTTTRNEYGDIRASHLVASEWQTGEVVFDGVRFSGTFVIVAYRTEFSTGPATETFTFRVLAKGVALMGWNIDPD